LERFKRWSVYTPPFWFAFGLASCAVVALRRFYQAGRHTAKEAAKCPEPLCPTSVLPPLGRCECHLLRGRYPSVIAPTGSCATPVGLSPTSALASFEESWQVVRSPCCPRELPDVISENLSLDAGSRTPAVHRVLSPVSSTMSSAFPKRRMGRLPAFCPTNYDFSQARCFEDADIP